MTILIVKKNGSRGKIQTIYSFIFNDLYIINTFICINKIKIRQIIELNNLYTELLNKLKQINKNTKTNQEINNVNKVNKVNKVKYLIRPSIKLIHFFKLINCYNHIKIHNNENYILLKDITNIFNNYIKSNKLQEDSYITIDKNLGFLFNIQQNKKIHLFELHEKLYNNYNIK